MNEDMEKCFADTVNRGSANQTQLSLIIDTLAMFASACNAGTQALNRLIVQEYQSAEANNEVARISRIMRGVSDALSGNREWAAPHTRTDSTAAAPETGNPATPDKTPPAAKNDPAAAAPSPRSEDAPKADTPANQPGADEKP